MLRELELVVASAATAVRKCPGHDCTRNELATPTQRASMRKTGAVAVGANVALERHDRQKAAAIALEAAVAQLQRTIEHLRDISAAP